MAVRSGSYKVSATPVTVFGHLLFIAVATLVLVWLLTFREGLAFESANKFKIFNLHPFLMVIGFILIAGEAIMAYKAIPVGRHVQRAVHLTLQAIALGCGIFGIVAIFKFNDELNIPDMVTLHSWLGMIAICLFGLQFLLGFFSFVFPGVESYSRAAYAPWHIFGGLVIFFLAICTAEMGLLEEFLFLGLFRGQEALIVNFTGFLLILFAVAVGLSVVLPRGY
ncbi:probable ascorbate-specific transmembrane electron transporter 1 [Durio zibethinus]|uniref:ascorbate ferrireductase (transmembrane) n=1 Tax=Durio zibethinus TaxID=66656 RepID=A0A6P6BF40_DURZI|nr:probable ascorbate-specific transmembrane electron transporter 1 [Durio zibethinus]